MKNSKLLTATAIFSVAITAALTTMSITSAFRGQEMSPGMGNGGTQITEEQRDAIHDTLENQDYEAWYEIMSENERNEQLLEVINESNFAKYVEMHNLRQQGQAKFQEANEIATELGIEKRGRMGKGMEQKMIKGDMNGYFRGKGFNGNCPMAE